MSSDDNRLRFHMGCGERLQSRRWIVRCISGALLRTDMKPGAGRTKHEQTRREEDRDES
jgi:hypothetical protein